MKTVEISLLHRPSLPTVHVFSVKLAQSEQENLSRNNKKKKIRHRRKTKLIRAESDKKQTNKQKNNNSHKVNIKTNKDASYKYLMSLRKKKTYKILFICEELNQKLILESHNHIVALYN